MTQLEDVGRWVTLIIFVQGFVGNVLSVVAWSSLTAKVAGARFFTALSVSDTLATIFGVTFIVPQLLGDHCHSMIFYVPYFMFYLLSAHITVAIITQRFLLFARPFSVSRLCSKVRQGVAILTLVFLTVAENVAYAVYVADAYTGCTEGVMPPRDTTFIMYYVYTVINGIPPCLLLVFSVLLIRELTKKTSASTASVMGRWDQMTTKLSLLVLWVSFMTLLAAVLHLVNMLYLINNWDELFGAAYNESKFHILVIIVLAREIASALKVSVKFCSYLAWCQAFRDVIKRGWRHLATCSREEPALHHADEDTQLSACL